MTRALKWLGLGVLGLSALAAIAATAFCFSDPWYVRRVLTFSPATDATTPRR